MNRLFSELKRIDTAKYAPVPFWSWNNKIEEKEAVRQIREMKKVGFGGFVIHARQGLKTEYLGEEWFSVIGACINEAVKLGMTVWFYDEFGYPSGFVGGALLEDVNNRAPYLEYAETDEFDDNAHVVYGLEDGNYVRLKKNDGYAGKYYNVYLRRSPSEVDILDPAVVKQFINKTYDEYYKRFKEYFGNTVRGFFTDEPQYYRYSTPTTNVIEKEFKSAYNEDVNDGLIYLFRSDESAYPFREKYYTLMNRLYTNHYYKALYEWCEAHDCELTGHSVEEPHLFSQMWGGAGCMPSYEYCQVPGIDHLCRTTDGVLDAVQVESVAAQFNKKQVMTESFACCGFDANPRILKYLADFQYLNGVNYTVVHLMNYSIQGQGIRDFPPTFSPHAAWWNEFKYFNKYLTELGYIFSETERKADVLVIHGMSDVYLTYDRHKDLESVKETDAKFFGFSNMLAEERVEYHFGDEWILERHGRIEDKKAVIGNRRYKYVVLPDLKNISASTYDFLKEYVKAGGKLCVVGKFPAYIGGEKRTADKIKGNVSLARLIKLNSPKIKNLSEAKVHQRTCSGKLGKFVFLLNVDEEKTATLKLDCAYSVIDLINGEKYRAEDILTLEPHKSVLLKKERVGALRANSGKLKDVTGDFWMRGMSDNNLIIDFAEYGRSVRKWTKKTYCAQLVDDLLRSGYKGDLYVKYTFTVKEKVSQMKLLSQNNNVIYAKLNGRKLRFGKSKYDVMFTESDITDAVKIGENELIYKIDFFEDPSVCYAIYGENVNEALRNKMTYDTLVEPVFIQGNFRVDDEHAIISRIMPENFSEIQKEGFKFFSGEIVLSGVVECDGDGFDLKLSGNFMAAEVIVNGLESAVAILDETVKVKKGVVSGKNMVDIVVKSSMRNMYGPHHVNGMQEWWGVHPGLFSFMGRWKDGVPAEFDGDYSVVKFGIDKIEIKG